MPSRSLAGVRSSGVAKIEEILSQRSDLSTFLVHLTKRSGASSGFDILKQILADQQIEARSPFGQAVDPLRKAGLPLMSQRCVCFTETPLVHVRLLLGAIDGRRTTLEPYGIALPKKVGRRASVNPVWYIDMTPGAPDWLSVPWNQLIDDAIAGHAELPFDRHPVAKLAPFVEQMGTWPNRRKEFWWEREWRKLGDFTLPGRLIVIAPESDHDELCAFVEALELDLQISLLDASWSLEQIIGGLAGFSPGDLGL